MAISEQRRVARVFMLRQTADWLLDLDDTTIIEGPNGEFDEMKCQEAVKLSARLNSMADKLEQKT